MKLCLRCKIEKSVEAFGNNRNRRDGLSCYCRLCANELTREWQHKNREHCRTVAQQWTRANPEKRRAIHRRQDAKPERKKQRGDYKARQRRYRENNLEKVRTRRCYHEATRRLDPSQRALDSIRRRLRHIMNGKSRGVMVILGYSGDELRAHLERLFKPGMTWANYGHVGERWHIDHVRPVSSFVFPDQLAECFALSNLQPLWARDNLAKSWRT